MGLVQGRGAVEWQDTITNRRALTLVGVGGVGALLLVVLVWRRREDDEALADEPGA